MKIDYHMHFEYGSYDIDWVKGFFESAKNKNIDEIGITEHSHGFIEFKELYYNDLILDNSSIGTFQKKWLKTNKFKCSIEYYEDFIKFLKSKNYPVKFGIEICNFKDQKKVENIISKYEFDYIIGSIHFIDGWAYDSSEIKAHWEKVNVYKIYEKYVEEIEKMAISGLYDVLGHPFNIRLFNYFPQHNIDKLLERAAKAIKESGMAIDINTGSLYRYPIKEIAPYPDFMKIAKKYDIPIIFSSDAHKPEHAGNYIKEAMDYAKSFGYSEFLTFDKRIATKHKI